MSKKLGLRLMTVWVAIECPHCHSTEVTKHGRSLVGKQRYRCQNSDCPYRTFVLTQTYPGRTQEVLQQIVEMTLSWEWGERYSPSVACQSHNSDSGIKKNSHTVTHVNQKLLQCLELESVEVEIVRVEEPEEAGIEESELDEMWSACRQKEQPQVVMACNRPLLVEKF